MSISLAGGESKSLGDIQLQPIGGGILPSPDIRLSNLTLTPKHCLQGDNLTIKVTATNYGSASGTATIGGTMANMAMPQKSITLAAGQSLDVSWSALTTFLGLGVYTVQVDELSDTFEIVAAPVSTATLKGVVLDNWTRNPVQARIVLDGAYETLTSGAMAYYTFENVAPGSHTLVAYADGYEVQSRSVTVVAGEVLSVPNFSLLPLVTYGSLSGSIYDASSGNLAADYPNCGIRVTLLDQNGQIISPDGGYYESNPQDVYGYYYWNKILSQNRCQLRFDNFGIWTDYAAAPKYWTYKTKIVSGVNIPPSGHIDVDVQLERQYQL